MMSDRTIFNNNKIIRELMNEEAFENDLIFNLIKKKSHTSLYNKSLSVFWAASSIFDINIKH